MCWPVSLALLLLCLSASLTAASDPAPLLVSSSQSSQPDAAAGSPYPIILDTDIGDDFDDMAALTYMLSAPSLYSLRAIVVSTFNTSARALITAYTLHRLNLTAIPILMGVGGEDDGRTYQAHWVPPSFTLASYAAQGGAVVADGIPALVQLLRDYQFDGSNAIHYVEIAPASSLAALLQADPSLSAKLSVFAMSGCIAVGYGNVSQQEAEYNVVTDTAASQLVYSFAPYYAPALPDVPSSAGLLISPLDSTIFIQFTGALWSSFLQHNDSAHPFVTTLLTAYQAWYDYGGKGNGALLPYSPSIGTSTMYDVQAAFSAGHPSRSKAADCSVAEPHLISQCLPLRVNDDGVTIVVKQGDVGYNVSVQVTVAGGRDNPYPAVTELGRVVLSSIAHEPLDAAAASHVKQRREKETQRREARSYL